MRLAGGSLILKIKKTTHACLWFSPHKARWIFYSLTYLFMLNKWWSGTSLQREICFHLSQLTNAPKRSMCMKLFVYINIYIYIYIYIRRWLIYSSCKLTLCIYIVALFSMRRTIYSMWYINQIRWSAIWLDNKKKRCLVGYRNRRIKSLRAIKRS
jgi:hypothetical protein